MILTFQSFLSKVLITPQPDIWQIQATALDLRIGTKLYYPDTKEEIELVPGVQFSLLPGVHVLLQTLEHVTLPSDVIGVVYPRSSTNRKGITVDMTGIVDAGYAGHLMVPVTNLTSKEVLFYPGERIASLVFQQVEVPVEVRESKYHDGGIAAKPDKEEEMRKLTDGSLFYEKTKQ